MFDLVLIVYQYYKLVDSLIKKERSRIGQSPYAVLQFLQHREEEKVDRNKKDEGMNFTKELKEDNKKEDMKIDVKDESWNEKQENGKDKERIRVR